MSLCIWIETFSMQQNQQGQSGSVPPTPLEDYKNFIDALVRIRQDVSARRVKENRLWPDRPENQAKNEFLGQLTDAQREILAHLLQHARDAGIHDVLAYLN